MTKPISVKAGSLPTLMLRSIARRIPQSPQTRSLHSPAKPPPSLTSTSNHHDLPSFLAYARRTALSPKSTVFVGTTYEYVTQRALRRLGFELTRVGARGDAGIDLLGVWHLPRAAAPGLAFPPLRVIVQCKALRGKAGPNLIRELEGAFAGAPSGWRGEGVVGLLVSEKSATKGVREALGRSRWPLGWVMLERIGEHGMGDIKGEEVDEGEDEGYGHGDVVVGKVRQLLWNPPAQQSGLEGLTVALKHKDERAGANNERKEGLDSECVLMWKGHLVEADLDTSGNTPVEDNG